MWVRGNYSTGERDRSLVSPSFDADQMGIILGTDYRLSSKSVIGASIAYLDSSIDFNPVGEGSLDTESMALSIYGSLYAAKSFYLDGLVNYAMADYDASRNISYSQGSGLGDLALDAAGSTEGDTLSAGLFGGYDFVFKGITISPNVGFFYVDAKIDGFTEGGAGGLNLIYDDQDFKSLTSNVGLRINATWNLPWVVLLPGLRFDFIREFEDDVDVFQVRFAADPNGMSAPPIRIETDNPDTSYTRMSLNLSAQFRFGFAGYVEYQRIGGFDQIDFQDVAFGFRMQRSF
jgi:outer membrane autotransporter protein